MYQIIKNLAEGAEAKIFLINYLNSEYILKERISKNYRIQKLNDLILKSRTKKEVKIIDKLKNIVNVPKIIYFDNTKIIMEYLKHKELKQYISKNPELIKKLAKEVIKMHNNDVIHGDLTLCNLLYDEINNKIYFIDFGLSFVSAKIEDKAMDLEVFKEIILADFSEDYWNIFKEEYSKDNKQIINQLEKIEKRKKYLG